MNMHSNYFISAHSPSSNGAAEQVVSIAMSGTRAMLQNTGVPPQFWAEASEPVELDTNSGE